MKKLFIFLSTAFFCSFFYLSCGDVCERDSDCAKGTHCGSSKSCIMVCRLNSDCESGQLCTSRGKCVTDDDAEKPPQQDGSEQPPVKEQPPGKEQLPTGCTNGAKQLCYEGADGTRGKGVCRAGERVCVNGMWGPCQGQVIPSKETCDSKDNDCNGQVDENLTGCGCKTNNDCPANKPNCQAGACIKFCSTNDDCEDSDYCSNDKYCKSCPDGGRSAKEVCDGKDNNCNGQIDENVTQACGASDVGECKKGTQTCKNGNWDICVGEVKPQKEVCDNKDNDCNGKVDDSCSAACALVASTTTLNFGQVDTNTSHKKQFTLTNQGDGECKISSILHADILPNGNHGAFKLLSKHAVPLTLASKSSIAIEYQFTPQQKAGFKSSLTFASNDLKNPSYVVSITGSAQDICLVTYLSKADFGSSKVSCGTPNKTIEIFSTGACQTATVKSIKLSNNSNKHFLLKHAPATPYQIQTGRSVKVEVAYKPSTQGIHTAILEFETDIIHQNPIKIDLEGEGVAKDEQTDVFTQAQAISDILFVMDNSCSMSPTQQKLGQNFNSFISIATSFKADFQVAVTTTDVPRQKGCFIGNTKILKNSTPNLANEFKVNIKAGTSGDPKERGLESALLALSPTALNGCNKGFLRKRARLSLIFVSDETEQSSKSGVEYVSFFKSLKTRYQLENVVASMIGGPSSTSNCHVSKLTKQPKYLEVVKQLTGEQGLICYQDWTTMLTNIGKKALAIQDTFFLSRSADPATIVVKVKGNTIPKSDTDGWRFDAAKNSIIFTGSTIPASGDNITVDYKATCLP